MNPNVNQSSNQNPQNPNSGMYKNGVYQGGIGQNHQVNPQQNVNPQMQYYNATPQYNNQSRSYNIPEEYKPISMWGYFGYNLLFAIPLVGFIVALVFAFGGNRNINVRNYAKSYFCLIIIGAVIGVIAGIIFLVFGGLSYATMANY